MSKAAALDDDPINARILNLVIDLGNTVLTKRAATDLHGQVSSRVFVIVGLHSCQYKIQTSREFQPNHALPQGHAHSRDSHIPLTGKTLRH